MIDNYTTALYKRFDPALFAVLEPTFKQKWKALAQADMCHRFFGGSIPLGTPKSSRDLVGSLYTFFRTFGPTYTQFLITEIYYSSFQEGFRQELEAAFASDEWQQLSISGTDQEKALMISTVINRYWPACNKYNMWYTKLRFGLKDVKTLQARYDRLTWAEPVAVTV